MKKGFKECPFCANEIKEEAIKCQYCHEFLNKKEEKKECPFCMNEIDADASKCPFCEEDLESKTPENLNKLKIRNTKRYKNRYLWIAGLVIVDIIFFCNLRLSAYRWGECFGSAIVRYVILMLIGGAIIKNICKGNENNPTKTKLTAGILYFLGYVTLALIIGYFGWF